MDKSKHLHTINNWWKIIFKKFAWLSWWKIILKKFAWFSCPLLFFGNFKDLSQHKVKLIKITTLTPTHWIEVIENDRFFSCWLFKYYPKNSHQQRFRFITFCVIFSVIDFCNIYNFLRNPYEYKEINKTTKETIISQNLQVLFLHTHTLSHTKRIENRVGYVQFKAAHKRLTSFSEYDRLLYYRRPRAGPTNVLQAKLWWRYFSIPF